LFRPRGHYFDASFLSTAGGCRADVGYLLFSHFGRFRKAAIGGIRP
jgi:hypothetical protein